MTYTPIKAYSPKVKSRKILILLSDKDYTILILSSPHNEKRTHAHMKPRLENHSDQACHHQAEQNKLPCHQGKKTTNTLAM